MLQILVIISPTIAMQKEAWGYAKVIHKEKREKKMDTCPNYQNNGYGDARLKKKEKRDE